MATVFVGAVIEVDDLAVFVAHWVVVGFVLNLHTGTGGRLAHGMGLRGLYRTHRGLQAGRYVVRVERDLHWRGFMGLFTCWRVC